MSIFSHGQAKVNPPASAAQIAAARTEMSDKLPDAVITLWQASNGVFFSESGVLLYSTTDIAERNNTYEVTEYAPHLLLIGDDSGGNGLFIPIIAKSTEVSRIDLGAIGSTEGTRVATDVVAWVSQGCPIPSQVHSETPEITEKVDIILIQVPQGGLKGMLLIKQKFALTLSAAQLKYAMEHPPTILVKDVYYSKYKYLCEEINKKQHCLKIAPTS